MHKYLLTSFILSSISLSGQNFSDDEYLQIVAQNLEVKNNIVSASGNVVAYSPNYYLTANRLIYDKNNSTVELFDDVSILKNDEIYSFSDYTYMDMKNETNKLLPFFMLDNKNKLWFNSSSTTSSKNNYQLEKSTLSSCDCKDPSWSIGFSSGDYNTTKQWINTYNTTLYIKDMPIFYTPYFGFPTNTDRRSGLLKPTLGWSKKEGLHYAQPVFIEFADNYDFEYIPQIRNQRGSGHAFKYRYKDSLYSQLNFEAAVFNEKVKFQNKMELENDKHYGFDLEYKRDKLFSTNNEDGFLLDVINMNDVDYINTKYDNDIMDYTNKFLESKVKYYFNTHNFYADLYLKFYNDISKDSNDDVMQSLPSSNIHKYSKNIFFDKLIYSTDINFERKTRVEGISANITDVSVPFSYSFSFFNDYLNFSLKEEIKYKNIKYTNETYDYDDVNYAQSNHNISIYTDLLKPYKDYIHTIKLDTSITYTDNIKNIGDIYDSTNSELSELSIFAITQTNENFSLGLNQSIYNRDSLKEIVNHKIKQAYVYDKTEDKYIKSNLENDLSIFYTYGTLSNRLYYNHEIKKIIDSSTTFKFTKGDYYFNLYYLYEKDTDTLENQKNLNYDFGFSINKNYKLSYKEEFDLTLDVVNKREYVFDINKKCWGINFKLIDSLVATNTTDDTALRQDILYMEFNLKQLFTLKQVHKFDERNE
ncbi:MAG: LPS-assembly protein LptD [Campylobacterota bacterium]|nr:LPS-assembly protein LptD [Campylobacterota bacterium]